MRREGSDAEPALISLCIDDGLSTLECTSVEPEQLAAIYIMLREKEVFVSVPAGFKKSFTADSLFSYSLRH